MTVSRLFEGLKQPFTFLNARKIKLDFKMGSMDADMHHDKLKKTFT
jgi:hypothetical protein